MKIKNEAEWPFKTAFISTSKCVGCERKLLADIEKCIKRIVMKAKAEWGWPKGVTILYGGFLRILTRSKVDGGCGYCQNCAEKLIVKLFT